MTTEELREEMYGDQLGLFEWRDMDKFAIEFCKRLIQLKMESVEIEGILTEVVFIDDAEEFFNSIK